MKSRRIPASSFALTLLAAGVAALPLAHAAGSHAGHSAAPADPCAARDAVPSLRCATAPTAIFDAEGRLWAAWSYGGHVYVNSSSDLGRSFSPPVPANRLPEPVAGDGENRPKIAVGSGGELYVSWVQRLDKPYSGHVRFARSTDRGATFSDPITVNDHLAVTSHRFESMAVAPNGDLYLAWLDKRDQMNEKGYIGAALYWSLSRDGGRSFAPNRKIADHTCECCRTVTAMDGALPVIAWRHIYEGNIRDHAFVRFESADRPGEPQRLSRDEWKIDACPHHGPALSIADEVYHAAWFDNAPERHGLFYARLTAHGAEAAAPIPFGSYERGASHPAVMGLGKQVWLVWKEVEGEETQLVAMRSGDGGASFEPARTIGRTSGSADHPQLLRNGEQVYASWQTAREGFSFIPLEAAP